MKLIKLHIKNYRSILDSKEIEVTKLFALIGRNNSGKSSVLKAINILFGEGKVAVTDFHKGVHRDPIEIKGTLKYYNEKNSKNELIEISAQSTYVDNKVKTKYLIDGEDKTDAVYKKTVPSILLISDIRDPNESQTGGQKKTYLKKILETAKMPEDKEKRHDELVEELTKMHEEKAKDLSGKLTEKFVSVTNEDGYEVHLDPDINLQKGIDYVSNLLNKNIPDLVPVNLLNCGTGLQSMYILSMLEVFAELEKNENAILLIEEPEVYLHPEYQRRMFKAIRRIADSNQVIFSTHSPIMVGEIWLTESVRQISLNEKGETQINPVHIETIIGELGIRYEDTLNSSLVVFVEGKTDVILYSLLLDNKKIKFISSDNNRAINYYAYLKILSSDYVTNDFVIIVDPDSKDPAARKKEIISEIEKQIAQRSPKLQPPNLEPRIFFLKKYAIESYFLKEEVLSKLLPSIPMTDIQNLVTTYGMYFEEKKKELEAGTLDEHQFERFLKPKKIFEKYESAKDAEEFRKFWSPHIDFLRIKETIHEACSKKRLAGGDWLEEASKILVTIKDPELEEMKLKILSFVAK